MPFINPYTFVPIEKKEPERKVPPHIEMIQEDGQEAKEAQSCLQTGEQEAKEALLSGYIECDLEIKSSLFIPNTSKAFRYLDCCYTDREGKKCDYKSVHSFQEFYSYDDLSDKEEQEGEQVPTEAPSSPRIPGSEIRGVIRSIYEQLTNSCFSVIDEENYPTRRSPVPKEAGLLDVTTNMLYPAERIMLNTTGGPRQHSFGEAVGLSTYQTGDEVKFDRTTHTYRTSGRFQTSTSGAVNLGNGSSNGSVLIGNSFPRKHHNSIFVQKSKTGVELGPNDIKRFDQVLEQYEKTMLPKGYKELYHDLKDKAKMGLLPVFYSVVNNPSRGEDYYYLSPSMITRDVFSNTINEILKENDQHHCCEGTDHKWCPACRLFGTVGKGDDKHALASRVRFTDTDIIQGAVFDEPRVLAILGNPRISSTEFYLERPKEVPGLGTVDVWNYDYATQWDGRTPKRVAYQAVLKGRKVYWLGADRYGSFRTAKDMREESEKFFGTRPNSDALKTFEQDYALKQVQAVRAMKSGNTVFRVYYENLEQEELELLLYALSFGNNDELLHRIGRGKPFGMGAVNIKVRTVMQQTYEISPEGRIAASMTSWIWSVAETKKKHREAVKYIEKYSKPLSPDDAKLVQYPLGEDKDGNQHIYQWFSNNRGKVNQESIAQELPRITEESKLEFNTTRGIDIPLASRAASGGLSGKNQEVLQKLLERMKK